MVRKDKLQNVFERLVHAGLLLLLFLSRPLVLSVGVGEREAVSCFIGRHPKSPFLSRLPSVSR